MNQQTWKWIRLILLVPVAAAAAAAVSVRMQERAGSTVEASTAGLAPEFNPAEVSEISMTWRNSGVSMTLDENKVWRVRERGDHPADAAYVAEFLDSLSRVRPLRPAMPSDREACSVLHLNVDEPENEKIPGVLVQLKNPEGKTLCAMTLGGGYFIKEPGPMEQENLPDGRWMAKVDSDGTLHPFLTASLFEEYHPMPGVWMDPPVFEGLGAVLRIQFKSHDSEWTIQRKAVKTSFVPVPAAAGKYVRPDLLNNLFANLAGRYTADAVNPGSEDVKELVSAGFLALEDSDGLIRTLRFYKLPGREEFVLARVETAVAANAANPEVAKKHAERFGGERAGWLYEVPIRFYEIFRKNPCGDEPGK